MELVESIIRHLRRDREQVEKQLVVQLHEMTQERPWSSLVIRQDHAIGTIPLVIL
jgi:hypothetical protein